VQLHGTFSVTCGGMPCDRTLGVTVGEQTVPGAFATIDSAANANASKTLTASGILTGVAAGTHTVSIGSKTSGSAIGAGNAGDVRVVAIVLGG
jgi:hypothetical protein